AAARAGEYFARAQIASSAFQQFDAIISIPPLTIIGPSAVTLDPGQKVRFRTNYDDAKSDLVTWSVVSGGGSFDAAHVYTAATAPGNSTIRAAFSPQQKDIVVTVRSVITPDYPAVEPSEVVDWDTNISAPTWTATAGSINSSSGIWTAPGVLGQTAKIGVSGGGFSVPPHVVIASKFPCDPTAMIPVDVSRKALISEAEDGTRAARIKNKSGGSQRKMELSFRNRDLTELEAVIAFWLANYPSKPFIFMDKVRNKRVVAYFASDLHYDVGASCDIDYSFRIVEKA